MHTDLARDERRLALVSAAVLAGIAAAVTLGKPGHASFLPPCIFQKLTGLFCPGCGSTRAVWYLVHGHPLKALGENALIVLLLPFIIYDLAAVLSRRWVTLSSRLHPWILWTLFGVLIAFTVARNIPLHPFTLLAPTDIR
ncbi:MAG TPA: DUF2752 domain-containing protein [Candidatus Koribacter sp.]|jgi:hypothetical protein